MPFDGQLYDATSPTLGLTWPLVRGKEVHNCKRAFAKCPVHEHHSTVPRIRRLHCLHCRFPPPVSLSLCTVAKFPKTENRKKNFSFFIFSVFDRNVSCFHIQFCFQNLTKNFNFFFMAAYACNNNQSNNLVVYPYNFVDFYPQNANFGVVTPQSLGVINPNLISPSQVLVPCNSPVFLVPSFNFPLNPSVLDQMDEERSLSLVQVKFS